MPPQTVREKNVHYLVLSGSVTHVTWDRHLRRQQRRRRLLWTLFVVVIVCLVSFFTN